MGFWDWFRKWRGSVGAGEVGASEGAMAASEGTMAAGGAVVDYSRLPEVTSILSRANRQMMEDMRLLASDPDGFFSLHRDWCDEQFGTAHKPAEQILEVFAYWLVGYERPHKFGAYIDWKEATDDILWNLEPAIAALGYPLTLADIPFSGQEDTMEALAAIDKHFAGRGYTLVTLDIGGDCYHLFVTPLDQYERLVALGAPMGFAFSNEYTI